MKNIETIDKIIVGETYYRIDFAWIPSKVENKLIWLKQFKTILKTTKIYPAIWGVTDTEFDYDVIGEELIN